MTRKPHCISKQRVGTRSAQEIPADFVVMPNEVGVLQTHRFGAHHLLPAE